MNNSSHEKKTSTGLKADRKIHRATFNQNKGSPGETLHISVPKLDDIVVLVSRSLPLVFNLMVTGHENSL